MTNCNNQGEWVDQWRDQHLGWTTCSDILWLVDALHIINIALAVGMMEDFIYCGHTKSGPSSVKSAYHCEWNFNMDVNLKELLILVALLEKIFERKSDRFMWFKYKKNARRVMMGALPWKGVLANRRVIPSSQCPICTVQCESIDHTLLLWPS